MNSLISFFHSWSFSSASFTNEQSSVAFFTHKKLKKEGLASIMGKNRRVGGGPPDPPPSFHRPCQDGRTNQRCPFQTNHCSHFRKLSRIVCKYISCLNVIPKKNKREYKMVWYYRVTYQISILNMKQFSGPFFFCLCQHHHRHHITVILCRHSVVQWYVVCTYQCNFRWILS